MSICAVAGITSACAVLVAVAGIVVWRLRRRGLKGKLWHQENRVKETLDLEISDVSALLPRLV
jgi:uncharacterized iron-regulated membrane protein